MQYIKETYATIKSLPPLNWNELDEDEGKYFYYDPYIPGEYESHKNIENLLDDRTNVSDIFGKDNYLRYYLDNE